MSVIHADCVEAMAGMEPESVDAIVTDPPYGLEFMGKEWDKLDGAGFHAPKDEGRTFTNASGHMYDNLKSLPRFGTAQKSQAWHQQWATAAYRVAKPSAYLLAFGGTRTVHRMTVALEDAGWIIRDMLVWGYASGFPKSKASLKPAWEPIVMARKPGPLRMLAIDECRIGITDDEREVIDSRSGGHGAPATSLPGWQGPKVKDGQPGELFKSDPAGRWPANIVLTDPIFDGGVEGVVGGGEQNSPAPYVRATDVQNWGRAEGSGLRDDKAGDVQDGYGDSGTYSRFFLLPRDSLSDALSGIIGTCRICNAPIAETPSTARTRPLDTALLSADTSPNDPPARPALDAANPSPSRATATAPRRARTPRGGTLASTGSEADQATASDTSGIDPSTSPAQQPDTSSPSDQPARTAEQPPTSTDTTTTTPAPWMCGRCADDATHGRTLPPPTLIGRRPQPDEGSYTRFLIVPKAARSDREPVLGGLPTTARDLWDERPSGSSMERLNRPPSTTPRANVHPTVKPTDLMRHLVRLVTPVGGIVLDPFLGSGTTALAAEMEGFEWIGIEREAEYVAIAEARLNGTQRGLGLGA